MPLSFGKSVDPIRSCPLLFLCSASISRPVQRPVRWSMPRDQSIPQQPIIGSPFCELCKSQMWLACIEPHDPDHDKRTFECPACPNITVRIVKCRAHANLQGEGDQSP